LTIHVEAGQHVVGARDGEQLLDLPRGDLVDVDADVALEGGDAPVLLEAIAVDGELDEAALPKAGGLTGLRLEARVQIARVLAHLGGGLRRGAEGANQPSRVPGRPGGELGALQDHDLHPEVREVVGDGRADDASADDDGAGVLGNGLRGLSHAARV
jgi:hypothetical protein